RLAARATNDVIWDWDLEAGTVRWNPAVAALFGWDDALEGTGPDWRGERIHPDDRDRVVAAVHAVIEGGGEHWQAEYRFRRADGTYAYVLDRGFMVRDDAGAPLRMVGAMQDLTERREAEEAVHQALRHAEASEARYRFLGESLLQQIWTAAPDGELDYVNRFVLDYFGRSAEEMIGKGWQG